MALTTLSWKLAGEGHAGLSAEASTVALLVLAFGKVLLVGYIFMGLSRAPRTLYRVLLCWCAAICTALVVLYGL